MDKIIGPMFEDLQIVQAIVEIIAMQAKVVWLIR
jgi:hypothetical protein